MKQVKPVVLQWVLIEYGTKKNRIESDIPYSVAEFRKVQDNDYRAFQVKSKFRPVYAKG